MSKYSFHFLLSFLLLNCDASNQTRPTPPVTPPPSNTNNNQPGKCFYGYMRDIESRNYELLLADSAKFNCGKTGGEWFVNKEIYGGSIACTNWTGVPNVEITFDMQFTKIQTLKITPRGSGGSFVGNSAQLGLPGVFPANAPINPQNEDRGWNASIPFTGVYTGKIELYCRYCDFSENKNMSILVLYRQQPVGTLIVNPQSAIARCQAAGTPSPHAHQ